MEARFLLDTNICIYIRRKKPDPVLQRFRALKQGEAALSVIILGELLYGAEKSAQLAAALELLRELAQALSDGPAGDGGGSLWNDAGGAGAQGADDREYRSVDCRACEGSRVDTGYE